MDIKKYIYKKKFKKINILTKLGSVVSMFIFSYECAEINILVKDSIIKHQKSYTKIEKKKKKKK
jgi:hypothetical protein